MKKTIYRLTIVSAMLTVLLYNMFIIHDSNHELTDIARLNIEALASSESDHDEPIKFKTCYFYVSSTFLPDEPSTYVTKCDGCRTTKATMYMGNAVCAGSQIIY